MDTLELGSSRSGRFHCVLVMIDPFMKWVEVVPLKRHDAASVAAAFLSVCVRWARQVSFVATTARNSETH